MDNLLLKNSIRLLVGGYINDGGNVEDIPQLLRDMSVDYEIEIIKES